MQAPFVFSTTNHSTEQAECFWLAKPLPRLPSFRAESAAVGNMLRSHNSW